MAAAAPELVVVLVGHGGHHPDDDVVGLRVGLHVDLGPGGGQVREIERLLEPGVQRDWQP